MPQLAEQLVGGDDLVRVRVGVGGRVGVRVGVRVRVGFRVGVRVRVTLEMTPLSRVLSVHAPSEPPDDCTARSGSTVRGLQR